MYKTYYEPPSGGDSFDWGTRDFEILGSRRRQRHVAQSNYWSKLPSR